MFNATFSNISAISWHHSGTPVLKHQKSIDLILYKTSNEFQMKKRALTFIDDTDCAITSQEFYLLSHRTLLFSVEIEGNQY
jgi:hypothetical protein